MTAFVVLVLALPLAGAVGAVVLGERRRAVTVAAAAATAVGWAVIVAASTPPELGRITLDPVLAAALAGTALLVSALPPASTFGSGAALSSITVLAATAGSGGEGIPDRPLAVGVVAVAALAALRLRTEAAARVVEVIPLVVGAGVIAVGATTTDADQAAPAVLVGAGLVLVGALRPSAPGRLVVPAVLLAVARLVPEALRSSVDPDLVSSVAAGVAVAVAIGLLVLARRPPVSVDRGGVAIAAAAAVLLALDLPGAAGAGLLAAAAAVLVLAAGEPLALVALLPALVAAPVALAPATEPGHAAAGGALVLLLVASTARPLVAAPRRPRPARLPTATSQRSSSADLARWGPTAAAVVFGLVPLWGWTGVGLDDAVAATTTAAAFALVAGVTLTASVGRSAGTLVARRAPTASSDGRTQQEQPLDVAQGIDPVETPSAP